MATGQGGTADRPFRIGWGAGLLMAAAVTFLSTLLPALLVVFLGGSPTAGGSAMTGGFIAGWLAFTGVMRLGMHRGWWA